MFVVHLNSLIFRLRLRKQFEPVPLISLAYFLLRVGANLTSMIEDDGAHANSAGSEDSVLKDPLYREVMDVLFLKRIEERKRGVSR